MITAIDTSVILDILGGDREYGSISEAALRRSAALGRLIACEIVWAEVSGFFAAADDARAAFASLSVEFEPMGLDATILAGMNWRRYRLRGGPRTRILADFLVGGHAFEQADRLLTRDSRFHRTYLPALSIVDPRSM